MRGLPIFSRGTKYGHPPSTPQTETNKKTICARLKRIFRGPPKPPPPQPQYRDEKKYKHVPTHSASSFTKTTTTAAMIAAAVDSKPPEEMEKESTARCGPTDDQLAHIDRSFGGQPVEAADHAPPDAAALELQALSKRMDEPLIQLDMSSET